MKIIRATDSVAREKLGKPVDLISLATTGTVSRIKQITFIERDGGRLKFSTKRSNNTPNENVITSRVFEFN